MYFTFYFFTICILTEKPNELPFWLFVSLTAISTFNCRNGQNNSCWPTAIFIAVGQQLFSFFFNIEEIFYKYMKKKLVVFNFCIVPHPSLKFKKTRINYSPVNY